METKIEYKFDHFCSLKLSVEIDNNFDGSSRIRTVEMDVDESQLIFHGFHTPKGLNKEERANCLIEFIYNFFKNKILAEL